MHIYCNVCGAHKEPKLSMYVRMCYHIICEDCLKTLCSVCNAKSLPFKINNCLPSYLSIYFRDPKSDGETDERVKHFHADQLSFNSQFDSWTGWDEEMKLSALAQSPAPAVYKSRARRASNAAGSSVKSVCGHTTLNMIEAKWFDPRVHYVTESPTHSRLVKNMQYLVIYHNLQVETEARRFFEDMEKYEEDMKKEEMEQLKTNEWVDTQSDGATAGAADTDTAEYKWDDDDDMEMQIEDDAEEFKKFFAELSLKDGYDKEDAGAEETYMEIENDAEEFKKFFAEQNLRDGYDKEDAGAEKTNTEIGGDAEGGETKSEGVKELKGKTE